VVKDGSSHSPLTEKDVASIRERYVREDINQAALGEDYGVSQYCVSDIINFKTWDHVESEVDDQLRSGGGSSRRTPRKLAQSDAEEIRRRYEEEDITQAVLGEEYGVDRSHISDIVNHKRLA
jgi:DNA-binding transcriptional regulator LsrR (DeoR family)